MKELLLGIDIGTSACKIAVFSGLNVVASSTRDYSVKYPQAGWAEQDVNDWWKAVCHGIRDVLTQGIDPSEIAGVGIDGQSWSAIPIDKNGQVLAPNPIWFDTRAAAVCEEAQKHIGAEAIFKISGNPFSPSYTLPKVLYWKKHYPQIIGNAEKILHCE